jgi:geranylgeranyl pyrophosphate synthase
MDADRARVEQALLEAVKTPDAYLTEIASHLISAGGKRLRPVMSIAASLVGRDGQSATDDVIQGGIACELVHLGSLYHDDVMDESETRRGVETVNARWGNLQAILAGDFLLARASEIAASLGVEVAGLKNCVIPTTWRVQSIPTSHPSMEKPRRCIQRLRALVALSVDMIAPRLTYSLITEPITAWCFK